LAIDSLCKVKSRPFQDEFSILERFMMGALGIAQSGLNAANAMLNVAANNIANGDTPGYESESVDLTDLATGGVTVSGISQDATLVDGKINNNVNLPDQMIDLTKAKILYNANAAVISISDQMYGTLLNVLDNQDSDGDGDNS
jgi:flagellar basal body rod protein FlgG